jgi:hypothetical protein
MNLQNTPLTELQEAFNTFGFLSEGSPDNSRGRNFHPMKDGQRLVTGECVRLHREI